MEVEEPVAVVEPTLPPGAPAKPAAQAELDDAYAMSLAEYWYSAFGPYRAMYTMSGKKCYHMKKEATKQYCVKFRVVPDAGVLVMRRFHYAKEAVGVGWEVTHWTDDAVLPDWVEFDPNEHDEDDDLETLEEEEREAQNGRETVGEELDDLKAEGEMSMAEILKKYYGIDATADDAPAPSPSPSPEPEEEEEGGGKRRRKRRRRSRQASEGGGGGAAAAASVATPEGKAAKRGKLAADAEGGGGGGEGEGAGAAGAGAGAGAGAAQQNAGAATPTPAAAVDADGAGAAVEGDAAASASTPTGSAAGSPESAGGGGGSAGGAATTAAAAAAAAAVAANKPPSFLDYFDPRNHEEETEIVSGVAEKKTSRVGEEYQCPLPAVEATYTPHPVYSRSTLRWRPPSEAEAARFDYAAFTAEVTAGCARPTLPLESGLHKLFQTEFDGAKALAAVKAGGGFVPSKPPWTDSERVAFEEGLLIVGKNFYRIHRDHVPSRTVREHVEYYYEWKWTPYYDEFVGRNWGFGKFRRKHTYEPGRDVDDFDAYPPLINPPSRMPSPAVMPVGDTLGGPRAFLSSGEIEGLEAAVAAANAQGVGSGAAIGNSKALPPEELNFGGPAGGGAIAAVDLSLNVEDLSARRASIGGAGDAPDA